MRKLSCYGVLLLASVGFSTARADIITFLDGADDHIIVTKTGNRLGLAYNPPLACGALTEAQLGNSCSITIVTLLPLGTLPTSPGMILSILDPNSNVLSDTLQLSPNIIAFSYDLTFRSDVEGTLLGTPGTPSITETGLVQTAFNVNWSDGTSDTIQFQSDLEGSTPVPEPGSMALMGGGLAIVLGLRQYLIRRRQIV